MNSVQPKYDFSSPPCIKDNGEGLGLYDTNKQHSTYDTNTYFYPGTRKAPFSGFSSNINTESELRNQHVKLSKTDNNKYVPHSKSNLYNFTMTTSNLQGPSSELNPHFLLFQDYDKLCAHKPDKQETNQSSDSSETCMFNNHSRLNK